jgi:hypothetical protein
VTVIVGILCEDGVVIGSDSAATYGPTPQVHTIEHQALKIEIIEGDVITAATGPVGLAQRLNDIFGSLFRTLRASDQPQQQQPIMVGPMGFQMSPIQVALSRVPQGQVPIDSITAIELARLAAETAISDFNRTRSIGQQSHGWGLGALLAFVKGDIPHLIEFDGRAIPSGAKGSSRSSAW